MSVFDGLRERMRWLTRSRRAERELHEELEFHIDMQARENQAAGMTPAEARRAAERTFGDVRGTKEDVRRQRGVGLVDDALRDLGYALRGLSRRPAFTVAAVGTLALGVGANTAVFSVVNGIVLQPLDYQQPQQLVSVWDGYFSSFRERNFIRDNATTLQAVASYAPWTVALTDVDAPTQLVAARTSANVFDVLGVGAAIGRTFSPDDDRPGAEPVAVLSHGLWMSSFGGDSSVVGQFIRIDGRQHRVLGVMAAGFEAIRANTQIWIPLADDPEQWYYRGNMTMLFGRLAPDATVQQADGELGQVVARMQEAHGRDDSYGQGASIIGLKESIVGDFQVLLYVLLGAVVLILLVAGANLGNLLVARAQSRKREFAMRATLGATGTRLARQLLVESGVLTLLGALAGVGLAFAGVRVLTSMLPAGMPRVNAVAVDETVLLVCLGFAAVVGIGFSLAPLARVARRDTTQAADGGRVTERRLGARLLVASQLALAVMLVVGAGLMMRTLWNISAVDPGFSHERVLSLRIQPAGPRYRDPAATQAFYRQAFERVRAVPGVEAVGAVQHLPLSGATWQMDAEIEGFVPPPGAPPGRVGYRIATPGYFDALGIPLVAGRAFTNEDDNTGPQVAIVNQALVDRYWPGQSALGRTIRRMDDSVSMTVVGVVGDVQYSSLLSAPVPEVYRSNQQANMRALMVAVRTAGPPAAAARAVQDAIWGIDPNVPISRVVPMSALVDDSIGDRRLLAMLLSVFAGVALTLGAVGVYGVTSFAVSRRTNEIGIRMALGASRGAVRATVFKDAMILAAVGVGAGLLGAAGLGRFLESFVVGVTPGDVSTFAGVAVILTVVAAVATYLPARRATLISPVEALREG